MQFDPYRHLFSLPCTITIPGDLTDRDLASHHLSVPRETSPGLPPVSFCSSLSTCLKLGSNLRQSN